jgi:hypothetical protein
LAPRFLAHDDRPRFCVERIAQGQLLAGNDVSHVVEAQRAFSQLRDPAALIHREERPSLTEQVFPYGLRLAMHQNLAFGQKPFRCVELNAVPRLRVLSFQSVFFLGAQFIEEHFCNGDADRLAMFVHEPVDGALHCPCVALPLWFNEVCGAVCTALLVFLTAAAWAGIIATNLVGHLQDSTLSRSAFAAVK